MPQAPIPSLDLKSPLQEVSSMKRIVGLSIMVLGLMMLVNAQDENKSHEHTGWICNSKCVNHDKPIATCDESCTDKSGDVMFVDENGKSTKISNPDKVKGQMGKKMKVKSQMMESGEMQIDEIIQGSFGY
jgi:hypothetical protein